LDAFVARELRGHSAQGQTVPLYLSCWVGRDEIVYQSKLAGKRSGLSPRELGVELLSTTIAHDVGLHVARPAMVSLTPKVLAEVEREYRFGIADATAFGVVWKAGLTPFLPEIELERISDEERATLLALDLILTNGDRTEPNPNVCWEGDRLLVFDFEHCLELPRLSFERRLQVHLESLQPLYETHLAAKRVGLSLLRRATENVLDGLAVEALERDGFALPLSWYEAWSDNVEYLGYIKSEPGPFLDRIGKLSL
jgi:hypothetical protein